MPNVNKIKNITSDCFFITKENGGLLVYSEECESNFKNANFYSNTEYRYRDISSKSFAVYTIIADYEGIDMVC